MKKQRKLILLVLLAVMLVAVSGCSKSKKTETKEKKATQKSLNFVLDVDNSFTILYEEDFDEDYYDKNELETMIDSEIQEFNSQYATDSSKGILKDSFSVESGRAKLNIKFNSYQDYINYEENYVDSNRNARFFIGTYDEMVAAGYKLVGKYVTTDGAEVGNAEELLKEADTYVLFTNQGFNMEISGEVVAFNKPVSYESTNKIVSTSDRRENYIIFKKTSASK